MKTAARVLALLGLALLLAAGYFFGVVNPRIAEEIRTEPRGVRAGETMLIALPTGKTIPVNYLHDGDTVYAGADFGWWRAVGDDGAPVRMLIRGEWLHGHARAVRDDPARRDAVFARLRPTAPVWLPEWAKAVLVEIRLAADP